MHSCISEKRYITYIKINSLFNMLLQLWIFSHLIYVVIDFSKIDYQYLKQVTRRNKPACIYCWSFQDLHPVCLPTDNTKKTTTRKLFGNGTAILYRSRRMERFLAFQIFYLVHLKLQVIV